MYINNSVTEKKKLGSKIVDGAYHTMIERINSNKNPQLFVMDSSSIANKKLLTFVKDVAKENNINFHPKFDIVSYSLVKDFAKIGMGISYITKEFTKLQGVNKND